MSYLVSELITNSWYLSGIVARNQETVTGDQMSDGFDLLNALLSFKTALQRLVPYFSQYQFNAVAGTETYFVPNLVKAETLVFYINNIRYSMFYQSRKVYFGNARVEGIQSLPFDWHIERCLGGANLYMYFLPQSNYPITLWGKFGLMEVTSLDQDLETTYDTFYIEYMRYALAEYMCSENNIEFQPQSQKKLNEYENIIMDISPMDLSVTKISTLQGETGINWGDVNIGKGWRP